MVQYENDPDSDTDIVAGPSFGGGKRNEQPLFGVPSFAQDTFDPVLFTTLARNYRLTGAYVYAEGAPVSTNYSITYAFRRHSIQPL